MRRLSVTRPLPTQPLISIVVPVYNGARFLAECLDSLAAQDHPAIEIVVVDDGSTDGSAAVAERFGAGRAPTVRVLRHPHRGLGTTRNAGVDAASGDFVAFCDADDTWKPHKATVQVRHLAAHPEIDIALCRQDTVVEPGTEQPAWLIPDQRYGDLDGISPTSGLCRRSVFEHVRFAEDMGVGTDLDFLVRARAAGFTIDVIDESLRVRRIHDDNMTTREGIALRPMFATVRQHLRGRR